MITSNQFYILLMFLVKNWQLLIVFLGVGLISIVGLYVYLLISEKVSNRVKIGSTLIIGFSSLLLTVIMGASMIVVFQVAQRIVSDPLFNQLIKLI